MEIGPGDGGRASEGVLKAAFESDGGSFKSDVDDVVKSSKKGVWGAVGIPEVRRGVGGDDDSPGEERSTAVLDVDDEGVAVEYV